MKIIVIGSLNTDLIATGVREFPKPNEHVYGDKLIIGPGGKSRNIAAMAGALSEPNTVAMLGRTVQDKYGLWKAPVDALTDAGVATEYIIYDENKDALPGIALIPVDVNGNNQIYVLPGVSNNFSVEDIDAAHALFEDVAKNDGYLVITMECPIDTLKHAILKASELGIKVLFDPGGVQIGDNIDELLGDVYLLKPNEHEAKTITDIEVTDLESARQAAKVIQDKGVKIVLVTVGEHGAFLFDGDNEQHIPIPEISNPSDTRDSTGCGDQTMATLASSLADGYDLADATKQAVISGTLQFYRSGIQPVSSQDLANY